jgi:hypothetical protein
MIQAKPSLYHRETCYVIVSGDESGMRISRISSPPVADRAETQRCVIPYYIAMTDLDVQIERLKAEASERWGNRWVVTSLHFADGDSQCYAIRSHGRTDDGHLVQDRLFISGSGETHSEGDRLDRRRLFTQQYKSPHERQ